MFTPIFTNPATVGPNQTAMDFGSVQGTFVSVTAPDSTANEGGDTAAFRLTRTGSTTAALTVYTDLSGGASAGDHTFNPVADTSTASPLEVFVIPVGSATLDVVVTPVNDASQEGPETIVMSLINGGSYIPAGAQTTTVTIDDNDTTSPRVTIVPTVAEATEAARRRRNLPYRASAGAPRRRSRFPLRGYSEWERDERQPVSGTMPR